MSYKYFDLDFITEWYADENCPECNGEGTIRSHEFDNPADFIDEPCYCLDRFFNTSFFYYDTGKDHVGLTYDEQIEQAKRDLERRICDENERHQRKMEDIWFAHRQELDRINDWRELPF